MCRKLICLGTLLSLLIAIPYARGDIGDELIGYWSCDAGTFSGTEVGDSSGKENHGIATGSPTPVPGKVGGALALGPGIWIAIDSVADDLAGADNMTVNAWVRTASDASTGSNVYWFGAHTPARSNIFMFGIAASTAQGRVNIYDGGAGGTALSSTDPVNDNQWHMLTYTKSGSVGTLYVDGVVQGTHTPRFPPFSSDSLWSIGQEWDSGGPSQFFHDDGKVDEVAIWRRALATAEIVTIYNAGNGMPLLRRPAASNPNPADGSMDVPRDVILSWTPGDYADKHDVYLGTSFGDVNDASRTSPLGVPVRQGQNVNTYDPAGLLDLAQTYYWRVDEVNESPDFAVYKGEVWSFTIEPVAYPIEANNITATASSSATGQGPDNTVNGSGLIGNLHSTVLTDMWLTAVGEPAPAWIQYEFDKDYKLHQMWVWNHNSLLEPSFGLGVNNATIEYSVDGANWTTLGTTHEFAQAPGASGYAANTTADLTGVAAKYVKLTATSNWGGIIPQYGLSEVQFFYVPVLAREPSPVSGATDTNVDAALSWRAGRETASHDVYLSTDEQSVIDETVSPVVSIPVGSSYASYAPVPLDLGKAYYWKINEVNEAETPTTWQGEIWNFSTQEYLLVEGFEDYNDYPPDEIYSTWLDGYENPTNGSQVGHLNPPFAEPGIVHSGSQSMPIYYDNSTASYSEATANVADLVIGEDWTKHGIKTLSLWSRGDPNNSAELMYVKLNGTKVVYDGEAADITQTMWQPWNIELAGFGVNLVNVTQLSIGLERIGAVGGLGVVYFDDIRLYPHSRQLLTPVEPSQDGLVGHWTFDEGSGTIAHDQSGQNNDGTFQGSPRHVPGKINGALQFDGDDDQITLTNVLPIGSSSNTAAAWVKVPMAGTAGLAATERVGIVLGNYPDTPNSNWELHAAGQTRLYWNGGQFNSYGTTDLRDNIWHHVAWVRDKAADATFTYIDGRLEATHPAAGADVTFATTHSIGGDNRSGPPNFHGLMDDLQIYSRALSHAEIAWLAGRTKPFDKPF